MQNAETNERKTQDNVVKQMQSSYESWISELTNQVLQQEIVTYQNHGNQGNEEEYDVFVSHAREDKESFADEFVSELESLGIKVWYDTKKMK